MKRGQLQRDAITLTSIFLPNRKLTGANGQRIYNDKNTSKVKIYNKKIENAKEGKGLQTRKRQRVRHLTIMYSKGKL